MSGPGWHASDEIIDSYFYISDLADMAEDEDEAHTISEGDAACDEEEG